MKNWSTSLIIKEMWIKIIMNPHNGPFRGPSLSQLSRHLLPAPKGTQTPPGAQMVSFPPAAPQSSRCRWKGTLIALQGGIWNGEAAWENSPASPEIVSNKEVPYPFLCIYLMVTALRTQVHKALYTSVYSIIHNKKKKTGNSQNVHQLMDRYTKCGGTPTQLNIWQWKE